ncbi:MAG: hypothetical protein K5871_11035 [Lachnospiraceae bacterium]|nr:hypothetical protein [Lachnospiraceae bacterium]
MANILLYIFILLAFAAIIITISIITYNRHLDKVTKGEIHDTHSSVPEPRSTASVIYKVVLMVIVIMTYIGISTISGMMSSMQNRITNLENDVRSLSYDVQDLKTELEQRDRLVSSFNYEFGTPVDNMVDLKIELWLRDYTDDTEVSLDIAGRHIELEKNSDRAFSGVVTVSIFDDCSLPWVNITENGQTIGETLEFFDYLFWEYLPFPMMNCQFESKPSLSGMKISGSYSFSLSPSDNVESVTMTYLSEGRDLKTMDITSQAVSGETITLESGLDIGDDLSFRTEIVTSDGYRIVEQRLMVFNAIEYPDDYEYERIYDMDGNLLWENDKL